MSYAETILNHVRIIHKSKENVETVLLDTRPGSGRVTGQIVAGLPLTESYDDSLDTFTFIIKESKTKVPLRSFDLITVYLYDGAYDTDPDTKQMVVLSDHVQTLSRQYVTYTHTVTAIEQTKILEKVKIFNLNLTNPYDTLYDQFKKALTNAEPVLRGVGFERKCRFSMSEKLENLLKDKPGEDFYNGNTDLRTVLDNILAPLNARVTVENIAFDSATKNIVNITLGYRSMTATRVASPVFTREANGVIVGEELANDAQDTAGTLFARGYNTLSDEPITFTSFFKSASQEVNDSNACAMLPFPISEKGITKFVINARFQLFYENMTRPKSMRVALPVDIAKFLLEQELYNLLPERSSTDDNDQEHFIHYQIGSSIIGAQEVYGYLLKSSSFELALLSCVREQYTNEQLNELLGRSDIISINSVEDDWYNAKFTLTYYPQFDTADVLSKPNVYDKDELLLGISDSQSENTLDMQRNGRRRKSLIKRTGNDEYYIDVVANRFKNLLPLMSKIDFKAKDYADKDVEDKYVIYKRECAIYDNFVKCRYYLSKDYHRVQEKAGVKREKHLFDIPLESDECPLVIRKFMVFGFGKGNVERGYRTEFVSSALQTLVGKNQGRAYVFYEFEEDGNTIPYIKMSTGKVNYLLFSTVAGDKKVFPADENNVFMLSALTYGQDRTMNFVARTLDNYSVDYSRDGYKFSVWGDAGHKIVYNPYVSEEEDTAGECVQFRLNYAFEYGPLADKESLSDNDAIIQRLPVVEDKYFAECMESPIEFDYFKDRTQRPLFCHITECVPTAADYGNLFIGSAFCRDNNLVHENGEGLQGLKLVVSTTKTFDDDDEWLPEGFTGSYTVSDYFEVVEEGYGVARIRFKGGLDRSSNITAWAIVNEKREIYLAANGALRDVYAWIMDFPE